MAHLPKSFMKTKIDSFKSVRALLRDFTRWTRFSAARDADGYPVDCHDSSACRFCLIGAMSRIYKTDKEFCRAKAKFYKANPGIVSIVSFNDEAGIVRYLNSLGSHHAKVLAAARRARI